MQEQLPQSSPSHDRKRVILHIGWEKTGTTAIQNFCGRNTKWLHRHDIDYPSVNDTSQHVFIHTELATKNPQRIRTLIDRVRTIVDESPCPTVIFSHETLHLDDATVIREMLAPYDTRIIAYVRNPADAAISHFATLIRYGALPAHNLPRAVRFYAKTLIPCFDYYWALESFAANFGRENLTVRHYHPDELIGNQSVSDFLAMIGLTDTDGSSWPQTRANPSIDADQLRLVARVTRACPGLTPPQRKELARTLFDKIIAQLGVSSDRSVQRFVSPTLRQKIIDHYEPNLRPLYDRYFDGRQIFHNTSPAAYTDPIDHDQVHERVIAIARVIRKTNLVPPRITRDVLARDPYAHREQQRPPSATSQPANQLESLKTQPTSG